MNKGILRWIALQGIFLVGFTFCYSILHISQPISTQDLFINANDTIKEYTSQRLSDCSNYLKFEKTKNLIYGIKLIQTPQKKTFKLHISAIEPINLNEKGLEGKNKEIALIKVKKGKEGNRFYADFLFKFSNIYEFRAFQDEKYIYVEYVNPREIYDTIIVIDPGHGGDDSGTLSYDNRIMEKDINSKVAYYLERELKKNEKVKVYCTRTNDTFCTPYERAAFINDVMPDICVSIHCNSGDNKNAKGVEVLYDRRTQNEGSILSKELATILVQELSEGMGRNRRELVPGNMIYIINHSNVPIALVELGFLSNKDEASFLSNKENQEKMAKTIYSGIMKALNKKES